MAENLPRSLTGVIEAARVGRTRRPTACRRIAGRRELVTRLDDLARRVVEREFGRLKHE